MAYFANGTEGYDYEERYCRRCKHDVDESCPILMAHMLYNYDACRDEKLRCVLNLLIPMSKDGLHPQECGFFEEEDDE